MEICSLTLAGSLAQHSERSTDREERWECDPDQVGARECVFLAFADSERKKKEKLEYMHGNAVKRGLVKKPGEWIWSSFLFYAKGEAGLVRIDPVG